MYSISCIAHTDIRSMDWHRRLNCMHLPGSSSGGGTPSMESSLELKSVMYRIV